MNISEEKVRGVSIDLLIQQKKVGYSIFLKIAGKLINYSKDVSLEELEALKVKKVETIYLLNEEYTKFIANQVQIQEHEQQREVKISQEVIKSYVNDHSLLKSLFTEVGLESKKIELINSITEKSLSIIQKTASLTDLFNHFKATHETSIVKKQMEIYLASEMLTAIFKQEELTRMDYYITQMSRAILVSDLLLSEEEYWDSYSKDKSKLSPKILNHGFDILKHLPLSDFLSPPFVTFIKQHHEKPDGKGFPKGVYHNQLNQFVSVYLIAETFVSKFLAKKMKLNVIPDLIDEVNIHYKKFLTPNIEKSLEAFNAVMKNEKAYFAEDLNE